MTSRLTYLVKIAVEDIAGTIAGYHYAIVDEPTQEKAQAKVEELEDAEFKATLGAEYYGRVEAVTQITIGKAWSLNELDIIDEIIGSTEFVHYVCTLQGPRPTFLTLNEGPT